MSKGKVKPIESFDQANARVRKLERAVTKMREQLSRIDPVLLEQERKLLSEELAKAHASMSVMVLKLSIVTEVPRYFRARGTTPSDYLYRMLDLLDQTDDWWQRRLNKSIEGWATLIATGDIA